MKAAGLCVALAVGLSAGFVMADVQEGFVEEFTTLDEGFWYISDGWSNGDHQSCTWSRDAVQVQAGVLRLSLRQDGGPEDMICGEIQSIGRYGFGVYEAAVRVPFASGTNSNFFTYVGPTQKELHNEIDFEFIARTGPTLQTNTYVDGTGGNEALIPAREGWMDIAFVWEPDRVRWFVDGALVRTLEGDKVPQISQKIYLSLWSTSMLTEWMGEFVWTGPLVFQVDRVAYSPLGAFCPFGGSILCGDDLWQDAASLQNLP
jgi:endo-1,3-1,4-beta-glycanase ExoK